MAMLAARRLKSPLYQWRVVQWNLLLLLWGATALSLLCLESIAG
jgi:hypothetical protein